MTYCKIKLKCTWMRDINLRALLIMITITNTRGFGEFLTKYTDNNYIYIYYILAFIRIFA